MDDRRIGGFSNHFTKFIENRGDPMTRPRRAYVDWDFSQLFPKKGIAIQ